MDSLTFTLPVEPVGCPRPRAFNAGNGRASVHMPEEYVAWKQTATVLLRNQVNRAADFCTLTGKMVPSVLLSPTVEVGIVAVFARPERRPKQAFQAHWATGLRVRRPCKPDADNVGKAALDALKSAVEHLLPDWDDARCDLSGVSRWWAAKDEDPGLVIVIRPVDRMVWEAENAEATILHLRRCLAVAEGGSFLDGEIIPGLDGWRSVAGCWQCGRYTVEHRRWWAVNEGARKCASAYDGILAANRAKVGS